MAGLLTVTSQAAARLAQRGLAVPRGEAVDRGQDADHELSFLPVMSGRYLPRSVSLRGWFGSGATESSGISRYRAGSWSGVSAVDR
jgi:hypothetical protein